MNKSDLTTMDFTNIDLNVVMNSSKPVTEPEKPTPQLNIHDGKINQCKKHDYGVEMLIHDNTIAVIKCKQCSFFKEIYVKDIEKMIK